MKFMKTVGMTQEWGSLHWKPFVTLFWWSLYWTHTCCTELELGRRQTSSSVLPLLWSWYPHEAIQPT